jgi:hypothetical protein
MCLKRRTKKHLHVKYMCEGSWLCAHVLEAKTICAAGQASQPENHILS